MDFIQLLRILLPMVGLLLIVIAIAVLLAALGPALIPLAIVVGLGLLIWLLRR